MGIALATEPSGDQPDVMVDINTTPLIDVMLVLLIMLIITIPIQLHSVDLNLPTGAPPASSAPPDIVRIEIDGAGALRWNGQALGEPEFGARLVSAAALPVQPELHIRPDRSVEYQAVAKVMAAVQRAGLIKVGVVGNEQYL